MNTGQLFQHTIVLLMGKQLENVKKIKSYLQESLMKDLHNHSTLSFGMLM